MKNAVHHSHELGGTFCAQYDTGRVSTTVSAEVTCKRCLKVMANRAYNDAVSALVAQGMDRLVALAAVAA
jgi:hypothetical protein